MLHELSTLKPFFEDPHQTYSARYIAKTANQSHITIAKKLEQYPFIERAKNGPYEGYKAIITPEFTQLRFIYNYQKLQESGLMQSLIKFYSQPAIVLFGSYATATQTPKSDIDILIVAESKKEMNCTEFEKILGHKVQLFIHNRKDIEQLKNKSPHLLNSMCNGIVLNGELEVFS